MKKIIQKKTPQKQLAPSRAKVTVSVPTKKVIPAGKIVMTSTDVKQLLISYQDLKNKYAELLKQNAVLEKTLMSANIEVDEKFGDNEDHVVIPSKKELEGYKDVDRQNIREVQHKTPSQIMENQSEMDDDSMNYPDEDEGLE